jgi:ribosomal protein S18 acetylase RimI-like enzyme
MPESQAPSGRGLMADPPVYRLAAPSDAAAIAQIHADNWRRHYRGAYLDSYLDGDVVADRIVVWRARLGEPEADRVTVVADRSGTLVGFAHVVLDHDPRWGSLLENLHVAMDQRRHGIGTFLLSAVANELQRTETSGPLHLWVLDQNKPAQSFYEARGGTRVESELRGPFPGGGNAMGHRYAWPDPVSLIRSAPHRPAVIDSI